MKKPNTTLLDSVLDLGTSSEDGDTGKEDDGGGGFGYGGGKGTGSGGGDGGGHDRDYDDGGYGGGGRDEVEDPAPFLADYVNHIYVKVPARGRGDSRLKGGSDSDDDDSDHTVWDLVEDVLPLLDSRGGPYFEKVGTHDNPFFIPFSVTEAVQTWNFAHPDRQFPVPGKSGGGGGDLGGQGGRSAGGGGDAFRKRSKGGGGSSNK